MTREQILHLCKSYIQYLDKYETLQNNDAVSSYDKICHCKWMLTQIPPFLNDYEDEKVMRWLGFVQGVFWSQNMFGINDMRNHNRDEKEKE